jgi:hypothetical protein
MRVRETIPAVGGRATRPARGGAGVLVRVLLACAALSACGSSTPTTDGGAGEVGGDSVIGEVGGNSVLGRIYLPGSERGVPWFARLATDPSTVATPVAQTTGKMAGILIDYEITGVPDGSYYILILIDVDRSGGSDPTPGDYYSWCNPPEDGNPPAAPNVFAYNSTPSRHDCGLVTR